MIAAKRETIKSISGIEKFANAYANAFEKAFFKLMRDHPLGNYQQELKKLANIIHNSICDELEAYDLFQFQSYIEYQQALELGIKKVRRNFNL